MQVMEAASLYLEVRMRILTLPRLSIGGSLVHYIEYNFFLSLDTRISQLMCYSRIESFPHGADQ